MMFGSLWKIVSGALTPVKSDMPVNIPGAVVIGGTAQAAGITDTSVTASQVAFFDANKKLESKTAAAARTALGVDASLSLFPKTNLLDNSGFGVISNADAAGGLATLVFDGGSTAAPTAGLAVSGANATGKVKSVTIISGAFATNDAAGTILLGSVTGTFVDNEAVTYTGGSVVVNGDEAIGVTNDPCNNDDTADWTVTGGQPAPVFDTDHYNLSSSGGGNIVRKTGSLTAGKLYVVEAELKDGTQAGATASLLFNDGASQESPLKTTTAAWVKHTHVFEAATTTAAGYGAIREADDIAGANFQMRNFSVYEHTPSCTAADALAADGHSKTATLDVYQVRGDSTHTTEYLGLLAVKTVAAAEYYNLKRIADLVSINHFRGKPVAFNLEVYSVSANDNVKIQIYDGVGTTESAFAGADAKETLEITRTINAAATEITFRVLFDGDAGDIAYINRDMAIEGASIGTGNYAPKPGELIYVEKAINSQLLNAKTGFSDVAATTLNLEADSRGMLPKNAKAVKVSTTINDSGSAAARCYLALRAGANEGIGYINELAGTPNDVPRGMRAPQKCDANGDIQYIIEATNANTLDISEFKYLAVELR